MRRLTILLGALAALMLVPAASAFAENKLTVNIVGTGSGEISSVGGSPEFGGEFEGEPAIKCNYASPGPATGTCENVRVNKGGFWEEFMENNLHYRGVGLSAFISSGSVLVSWGVGEHGGNGCEEPARGECLALAETGTDIEITPVICLEGQTEEECLASTPAGPELTVQKLGTGTGTVVSSPAGINCGLACPEETASFAENTLVTLTANPASGSVFTSWTGCTKTIEGTGAKGRKCMVQMTKALTVKAKFTAVQAITATKDSGGNGFGTVSSAPGGIACGSACGSATALYTEGSTVTLKAAAVASTSTFAGWTSCPGTEEGNLCKVVASAAKTATAKFNLIQQFALTVTKSGFGTGTVSSSPAGISCGPTCTTTSASYNVNKEVTLKAVAFTGSEFGGWSGACSGTSPECKVKITEALSVGAEFK